MRFFADNHDYISALRRQAVPLKDPNPITYRMLHEDAAGMGLCPEFFAISNIDSEAEVTCNCNWDAGHEPHCDIVAANKLRGRLGGTNV